MHRMAQRDYLFLMVTVQKVYQFLDLHWLCQINLGSSNDSWEQSNNWTIFVHYCQDQGRIYLGMKLGHLNRTLTSKFKSNHPLSFQQMFLTLHKCYYTRSLTLLANQNYLLVKHSCHAAQFGSEIFMKN